MNRKITFPELVDSIAELTNTSKRVSESFLKELFGIIREALEREETVKIKNLGTFKVVEIASRKSVNVNSGEDMEIPAHKKVSFTPDKSLAEAINMPFEGFETVVLDDDITDENLKELASVDDEPQPPVFKGEDDIQPEIEVAEVVQSDNKNDEEVAAETDVAEVITEPENEVEPATEPAVDSQDERSSSNTEIEQEVGYEAEESSLVTDASVEDEELEEETARVKRKSYFWGFLSGIAVSILIGCVAVAVCNSCFGFIFSTDAQTEQATAVADMTDTENAVAEKQDSLQPMADTVAPPVDVAPKEKPVVLDTVRVNNFLTKMSRRYYGRYEFWVYIYEENKDKIQNPNNVEPGLVVVIPPVEKYGIDKNSPKSVRKANKLAAEIQKSIGNK